MDSDAENSGKGVGGGGGDGGKEARWATEDRARKKMSAFHRFIGRIKSATNYLVVGCQ